MPAAPPSSASRIASAEELDADLAFGRAERAAQADLRAAFEHADDHDVGDADRADEERDRAEAEEQAVEGAFGVGFGDERVGRLGDVDLAGVLGVGGGGEHVVDGVDLVGLGADVDLGRVADRGVAVEHARVAEVAWRRRGSRSGRESSISGASAAGLRMPAT